MKRLVAGSVLLGFLLAGCAVSAPEVKRYHLRPGPSDTAPRLPDRNRPTLTVEAVSVASFLRADGIVYQTGEHTVSVARSHRWVEPLPRQLQRGLADVLGRRLTSAAVFGESDRAPGASHVLTVHVEAFHGRYDGTARIGGTWTLRDPEGRLVFREAFGTRVALERDGYAALVAALSRGWQQSGRDMADRLEAYF